MKNENNHVVFYRLSSLRASYWCWSRKDYDEDYLKHISISIAYRDETINSFSTSLKYNGSHVKCDSEEKWAQKWFQINNQGIYAPPVPCVTNSKTVPVASFQWEHYGKYL